MIALTLLFAMGVVPGGQAAAVLQSPVAEFRVLPSGYVEAVLRSKGGRLQLDDGGAEAGDRLWIDGHAVAPVPYRLSGTPSDRRAELHASVEGGSIEKTLVVQLSDDAPNLAVVSIEYRNLGKVPIHIDRIEFDRHRFNARLADPATRADDFWTFQGSARKWGEGEVLAVDPKFERTNRMATVEGPEGEGGGIPVTAFWTRRAGVATGHIEPIPAVLDLPARRTPDGPIESLIALEPGVTLQPGESYRTPRGFIAIYRGDFHEALSAYARAVRIPHVVGQPAAYQAAWCGWGYGFKITPELMLGAIPKLKEYNLRWATLDDGWFAGYGDWDPNPTAFPGASLQKMVHEFHRQGFRVQLWWYPLAVEDGQGRYVSHEYRLSNVVALHPEWLILDQAGRHARFGRDLAVLCPALPEVREYFRNLTIRFLRDWDFDGSKLDVIYSVPRCYNPRHGHRRPEESVEAMGEVYRTIYETSRSLKPESVTQICPCGTTPNIGWLPFMNQAVAGDPVGSVQVRMRLKMYKALLGPRAAVTGDHVEYTADGFTGTDMASTIGLGGIPGTRFTWPGFGPNHHYFLDPAKDAEFGKWFGIYESKQLGSANFRSLYVHGYDRPEGYAIEKDGSMYYAFFAPETVHGQTAGRWRGRIELRGLGAGRYRLRDYARGADLGVVNSRSPFFDADFDSYLLRRGAAGERRPMRRREVLGLMGAASVPARTTARRQPDRWRGQTWQA